MIYFRVRVSKKEHQRKNRKENSFFTLKTFLHVNHFALKTFLHAIYMLNIIFTR